MASQPTSRKRRLDANRANARLSTGPRTAAGKAKSSLNAVKTGLTGCTVVLPGEDAARYRAHVERFHRELQPVGELETRLVQNLADAQWRLDRIPGLESGILALGRKRCADDLFAEEKDPAVRETLLDAHVFLAEAQGLKNLYLQESCLLRQYERDLRELKERRKERAEEEQKQNAERQWEEKKRSILRCGCDDCLRLARRLRPQLIGRQALPDTVASNLQTEQKPRPSPRNLKGEGK